MKKKIWTVILLTSMVPNVYAKAILNVNGEIQVNGKVVINEQGKFLGVMGKFKSVDLTKYSFWPSAGKKVTSTGEAYSYSTSSVDYKTTQTVEQTPDYRLFTDTPDQGDESWNKTIFGDGIQTPYQETVEYSDGRRETHEFEILIEWPATVQIGQSFTWSAIKTITDNQTSVSRKVVEVITNTLAEVIDYKVGEQVLKDCLSVTINTPESLAFQVICPGYGMVENLWPAPDGFWHSKATKVEDL